MQQNAKPKTRSKMILMWAFILGNIVFWLAFWIWLFSNDQTPQPEMDAWAAIGASVLSMIVGGFLLGMGALGYLVLTLTECFTFNYKRPVWNSLKVKMYFANISVILAVLLGVGFMLAAVAAQFLRLLGLSQPMAQMIPVFLVLVLGQVILIWIRFWAPMEKRLIHKRLLAQGFSSERLRTGYPVGLSDPTRSSFKKFSSIEEDVGMLWFSADQLVYCGDQQRFNIERDQLTGVMRKADAGSVTMLSGTTHVILQVTRPDGGIGQIRLHSEGVWTLGASRRGMNELAQRIAAWQGH